MQQIQQQKIQQDVDTRCEMADDSAVSSSMDFDPPESSQPQKDPKANSDLVVLNLTALIMGG